MSQSPIWHPFIQHGLGETIPLIDRAEGAFLHGGDSRRWIDAISSWWVTHHGHCHPRIMAAIADQAQQLDQLIFAGWTHEPAETLVAGLRAIMPPALTRVFFSDSSSTAVDVALKMGLGFWRNRGIARHGIGAMAHSYHADNLGTMSVGARGVFNNACEPLLFDVTTVPFPAAGAEQAILDALEAACRRRRRLHRRAAGPQQGRDAGLSARGPRREAPHLRGPRGPVHRREGAAACPKAPGRTVEMPSCRCPPQRSALSRNALIFAP